MWKFKFTLRQNLTGKSLLFVPWPSMAFSRDTNPTTRSIYILWLFLEFEIEFYKMIKPIK